MLFKSIAAFLPLASLVAAVAPGSAYMVVYQPNEGFNKITSEIYLDGKTWRNSGYFAATQSQFLNQEWFYWGVQPSAEKGHKFKFIFSGFGDGATVVDTKRCHSGANGGPGTSCSVDVDNWDYDTWFKFEVVNIADLPNRGHTWKATVTNESTGEKIELGTISTTAVYGRFDGQFKNFLDYYPSYNSDKNLPASQKPCWPYAKALFKDPRGNDSYRSEVLSTNHDANNIAKEDKCAVKENKANLRAMFADDLLVVEAGFLPGSPTNADLPGTSSSSKPNPQPSPSTSSKPNPPNPSPSTSSKPNPPNPSSSSNPQPSPSPSTKPRPKCKCRSTCEKRKRNGYLY